MNHHHANESWIELNCNFRFVALRSYLVLFVPHSIWTSSSQVQIRSQLDPLSEKRTVSICESPFGKRKFAFNKALFSLTFNQLCTRQHLVTMGTNGQMSANVSLMLVGRVHWRSLGNSANFGGFNLNPVWRQAPNWRCARRVLRLKCSLGDSLIVDNGHHNVHRNVHRNVRRTAATLWVTPTTASNSLLITIEFWSSFWRSSRGPIQWTAMFIMLMWESTAADNEHMWCAKWTRIHLMRPTHVAIYTHTVCRQCGQWCCVLVRLLCAIESSSSLKCTRCNRSSGGEREASRAH